MYVYFAARSQAEAFYRWLSTTDLMQLRNSLIIVDELLEIPLLDLREFMHNIVKAH